ncbi:MAG: GxxExxY protein [Candidatus Omnitrophica bacterium]|nr:GxxExxY protein [Candidatus Omnitrophota bacterium]
MTKLIYKDLSYKIQGAFFEIYKSFRDAHKEAIYHKALVKELKQLNLKIESEKRIKIEYKGTLVGFYVPDIIVNELVLIEIKSKPIITKNDSHQFWHYLKVSDYKLGYLVNFGKPDGVEFQRRVYDTARTPAQSFA